LVDDFGRFGIFADCDRFPAVTQELPLATAPNHPRKGRVKFIANPASQGEGGTSIARFFP
jgi:hypothetical protein